VVFIEWYWAADKHALEFFYKEAWRWEHFQVHVCGVVEAEQLTCAGLLFNLF
jgi:hypothetical protein